MTGVPSNVILPFVGIEFDASRAQGSAGIMPFSTLLIGQKLAGGSITAETVTQVYSEAQVETLCDSGSMLHCMAKRYFANNKFTDCYIVALDDAVGTQATRVVTITGPATENGEFPLYINGYRISTGITDGDTATEIGDNLVTALVDYPHIPFTAANVTGTVTFTARNDGVAAGDNSMTYCDEPTEALPNGVGVSIAATTPGTVDPDIQDAIDVFGSSWFNVIVNPYDDATNLATLEDYLETVFGPTVQRDAVAVQAKRDTVANLITFATTSGRNSQSCALLDAGGRKCATYEFAAAVGGAWAASAQDDPAVPLQRLVIKGIRTNSISDRRTFTERNSLAINAVSTFTDDNGVQSEACISMYLENSAGAADTAYQQLNRLLILMRLRWSFVNRILSKYPRAKLTSDATRVKSGQQIITPDIGKAEALAWYMDSAYEGWVDVGDDAVNQFRDDLVCRVSSTNPDRLEWILSPDLINQFIVGSGTLQFVV